MSHVQKGSHVTCISLSTFAQFPPKNVHSPTSPHKVLHLPSDVLSPVIFDPYKNARSNMACVPFKWDLSMVSTNIRNPSNWSPPHAMAKGHERSEDFSTTLPLGGLPVLPGLPISSSTQHCIQEKKIP